MYRVISVSYTHLDVYKRQDLIRNTHIYGLSTEEMELVALTAKYNELDYPDATDFEFCSLSQKNQLVVSKLVAIFRLANAMDISRLQKFYNLRIRLEEDTLTVFCENNRDVQLEEWAFQSCQPYFEAVSYTHLLPEFLPAWESCRRFGCKEKPAFCTRLQALHRRSSVPSTFLRKGTVRQFLPRFVTRLPGMATG